MMTKKFWGQNLAHTQKVFILSQKILELIAKKIQKVQRSILSVVNKSFIIFLGGWIIACVHPHWGLGISQQNPEIFQHEFTVLFEFSLNLIRHVRPFTGLTESYIDKLYHALGIEESVAFEIWRSGKQSKLCDSHWEYF